MESVQTALHEFLAAKDALKEAKEALNDALMETVVYKNAFDACVTAPECSEKDAKKHALTVALKHFSEA